MLKQQELQPARRNVSGSRSACILEKLDKEPSDRELVSIASAIGNGWEQLADVLGVTKPSVERIKLDFGYSLIEQINNMLKHWKRGNANKATFRVLFLEMKRCTAVTIDWEQLRKEVGFGIEGLKKDLLMVIKRDLFDGRLISLNQSQIANIKEVGKAKELAKTNGAKVFATETSVPGFNIKVVIKELHINNNDLDKMRSITNEKLAARILHFGIVPLLAYHEDLLTDQTVRYRYFSFVSPYFEGGDLLKAIEEDTKSISINATNPVRMTQKTRLKIIYQVASAISYLHSPVKDFRNDVLHMDIKSLNIVLDLSNNARLIDFGLAREMKEPNDTSLDTLFPISGSVGYFPTTHFEGLTKFHDYHNFGIVIRELLTGISPVKRFANCTLQTMSKWSLKENIQVLMREVGAEKWTRKSEVECEVCVVNHAAAESEFLKHDEMEESIEVVTPNELGKEDNTMWSKVQSAFKKISMQNLKTLIVVYSGHHGFQTKQENAENRDQSINPLKSVTGSTIDDNEGFFQLSENELMQDVELCNEIQKLRTVEKVFIFEDCCHGDAEIKAALKDKIVVQFNSSTATTTSSVDHRKKESKYIGVLIKALTATDETKQKLFQHTDCTRCKDIAEILFTGSFLTVNTLHTFIENYIEHFKVTEMKSIGRPSFSAQKLSEKDCILAYRYHFPVVVQFKIKTPKGGEGKSELLSLNQFENVQKLRESLFRNILGDGDSTKYLVKNEDQLKAYAAAVSIQVEHGPREVHLKEIKSLEQASSAWIARRELIAQIRNVAKIDFQDNDVADIVSPNHVEEIFKNMCMVPPQICSYNPSEEDVSNVKVHIVFSKKQCRGCSKILAINLLSPGESKRGAIKYNDFDERVYNL
ncbi:WAKLC-like protein [Mya arenaria]|uniref:WAKLC-like protein n=1 Tax=Mya arenaria TaxID=6604 RepID=A0ABY7DXQ7_MYAAR|nr:WAKLC-like protein [Mya arenaria]